MCDLTALNRVFFLDSTKLLQNHGEIQVKYWLQNGQNRLDSIAFLVKSIVRLGLEASEATKSIGSHQVSGLNSDQIRVKSKVKSKMDFT